MRGTGIGAVVAGTLYSMFDGGARTSEISGQDPEDVSWRDRAQYSGANPIGDIANLTEDYFLKPVLGIDSGMDSDGFTRAYVGMVNDFSNAVESFITDPIESSKKIIESIDQSKWLNDIRASVTDGIEWTVNAYNDMEKLAVDTAKTAWNSEIMTNMRAGLSDAYEQTKNMFTDIADSTKKWLGRQYDEHIKGTWGEDAFKAIEDAHEDAVSWTTNAMERLGSFIGDVFGDDEDKADEDKADEDIPVQDRRLPSDNGFDADSKSFEAPEPMSNRLVETLAGFDVSGSLGNQTVTAGNDMSTTVVNSGGGQTASFAPPPKDNGVLDSDRSLRANTRGNMRSAVGGM
jgi:hypothetical protein